MMCRKAFQVIRNFSSQNSVLFLSHYNVDLESTVMNDRCIKQGFTLELKNSALS